MVLGVHVCVQQTLKAIAETVLVRWAQLGDAPLRGQLYTGLSHQGLVESTHWGALHERGGKGTHGRHGTSGGGTHRSLDQSVILYGGGPDTFCW